MQVLSIQDLKKEFQGEVLFDHVNFSMNSSDRVALIGNNGCGKSTLLKMILSKEEITSGAIVISKGIRIGYLSQEVIDNVKNCLYDEVLHVFDELIKKEKELEEIALLAQNDEKYLEQYGKKQIAFSNNGGYEFRYKIEMMLSKFGFDKDDYNRKLSSFSGGERTKLAFVKLLLIEPDLLILDEPTNHLDLSTIEWLENYLVTYSGALLFVSHDRYFIDALSNKIVEIEFKKSFTFKGNYEDFIHEKKIIYENQLKAYNNQQKEIEKMNRFIEYFRYKPRFVSRVHDKEKKLEHLKLIEKPNKDNQKLKIHFQGESLENKEIIKIENLCIGYDIPLVNDINFSIFGKNHIAVMGDNGSGKSTLLKVIMEELKPLEGNVIFKRHVKIGYIDQHHIDIKGEETILENLMRDFPNLGEKQLRNHLGKFNFVGDDYSKKLEMLSGGEKMRLVLSKIILKNYDLLLLDEPTNHLDMTTRQALINALKEYQGTIVFVSHDRFFVDEIATHILFFHNKKPYFHEGCYHDFKDYEKELLQEKQVEEEKVKKEVSIPVNKPSNNSLKLEEKITALENKIKQLKEDQFKEENYMDYKKMEKLDKEIATLEDELNKLEELYFS